MDKSNSPEKGERFSDYFAPSEREEGKFDEYWEQIYKKWVDLKRQLDDLLLKEFPSGSYYAGSKVEYDKTLKKFEARYEKELDAKRMKGF